MQLKIGDFVVHPAFGMGHIVEVADTSIVEATKEIDTLLQATQAAALK